MIFVYLLVIAIVVWVIRFLLTKDDLNKINKLSDEFDKWLESDGKTKRPSNSLFAELFKVVYKDIKPTVKTNDLGEFHGYKAIYNNECGVIESFPTAHPQVLQTELVTINNLKDYFRGKYSNNFSLAFWIRFYIFLPSNVVKYFGVKEDSVIEKLLNLIYWILLSVIIFLRPLIAQWINHLLR